MKRITVVPAVAATLIGLLVLWPMAAKSQQDAPGAPGNAPDPSAQQPLPANASWSDIDRRPHLGDLQPAVYVWRDRDDVYIVLKDPDHVWTDKIDGEATAPYGNLSHTASYGDDSRGQIEQPAPDRVHFSVDGGDGIAGVKFHMDAGHSLVIMVRAGGVSIDDRIFLGVSHIQAPSDPVVISRNN